MIFGGSGGYRSFVDYSPSVLTDAGVSDLVR